jgi:hypothetical protein
VWEVFGCGCLVLTWYQPSSSTHYQWLSKNFITTLDGRITLRWILNVMWKGVMWDDAADKRQTVVITQQTSVFSSEAANFVPRWRKHDFRLPKRVVVISYKILGQPIGKNSTQLAA